MTSLFAFASPNVLCFEHGDDDCVRNERHVRRPILHGSRICFDSNVHSFYLLILPRARRPRRNVFGTWREEFRNESSTEPG